MANKSTKRQNHHRGQSRQSAANAPTAAANCRKTEAALARATQAVVEFAKSAIAMENACTAAAIAVASDRYTVNTSPNVFALDRMSQVAKNALSGIDNIRGQPSIGG